MDAEILVLAAMAARIAGAGRVAANQLQRIGTGA
jgi:hypothetical protein